jgi:Polyketide cyclase / dehydrase and lipid transport
MRTWEVELGFEVVIGINASEERVWAALTDVEHWPDWTSSMTSVARIDSGSIGVAAVTSRAARGRRSEPLTGVGDRTGIGVLEELHFGPHAPTGLTGSSTERFLSGPSLNGLVLDGRARIDPGGADEAILHGATLRT